MGKRKGFTLVELLIVVVIIGIIASIAIPKFTEVRQKAFLSSLKTDLKHLATQQEMYHNTQFSYGSTLALIGGSESDGVTITINEATGTGWAATASHAGLVAQHCGVYKGMRRLRAGTPVRPRESSPARLRAEPPSLQRTHPLHKLEVVVIEDAGVKNLRRLALLPQVPCEHEFPDTPSS